MRAVRVVQRAAVVALALLTGSGAVRVRGIDSSSRPPASGRHLEAPPAGLARADWQALRGAIESSSYRAWPIVSRGSERAYEASNREQGYVSAFRASGINLKSKESLRGSWELSLAVTRYGHAGDLALVPTAPPTVEKERVTYQRGLVVEWYVNRPGGLEQGFELRPPDHHRDEPLVVEMELGGGLRAQPGRDGVLFVDDRGGKAVRYGAVKAWDADGRPLAARLDADGARVRLTVDAQAARFPVTVDPTFEHEARLLGRVDPIGRANVWMGSSIAIAGDTAVVGAPGSTAGFGQLGSAYVFVRSGSTWALQQRLRNPEADPNDAENFGWSVSVSGDTVVVGAPYDTRDVYGEGSAYVFVRSGGVWAVQQSLRAPDAAMGDRFGYSVSVSGDTVVVGSDGGTYADRRPGAAYAFVRSGSSWTLQQTLVAADPVPGAWLGNSVSLVGDTVIVGAPRALNPNGASTGAAYVFVRTAGSWSQQQKILALDGVNPDYFGASTSLSGETALIGAPFHGAFRGSAYVFVRSGTTWTQEQELVAADGAPYDDFGRQVAIVGDLAVVGADLDDTSAGVDRGSAYVFSRVATIWTQSQHLVATDGAARDVMGSGVAAAGGTMLVGASGVDAGGAVDSGAAYAFGLSGGLWQQQEKLIPGDEIADDQLGYSVCLSGDTLVAGALKDDTALGNDTGSAYVYVRAGGTWTEQQKLSSPEPVGSFGYSVATSGDTLLVGAPSHANFLGAVYVYVRTAGTWTLQQKLVGAVPYAMFGRSVALSGDTAVVGAYDDNQVNGDPGAAFVFVRSGSTWTPQQTLLASDRAANDAFGAAVSVDGESVVVGAPRADLARGEDTGAAYVFVRSGTTWTQQRKLTASDGFRLDNFGFGASIAGDTALVGAPFSVDARGAAYVYVRSGATWAEQQKLVVPDAPFLAQVGYSVSLSGERALLGAAGDAGKGSAYLFSRTAGTWAQSQKLLSPPDGDTFGAFGYAVSMSGDRGAIGDFRHLGANGLEGGSVDIFALGFADLGVSKTDGVTQVAAGRSLTYQIVVSNAGPHTAIGALVKDPLPPSLSCATSCAGTGGARCGQGALSPGVDDRIDIPAGQTVTYTSTCTVSPVSSGVIANTATVTAPPEVTDLDSSDNAATDIDTVLPAVSIEDVTATREAGAAVFRVLLSEPHPSPVTVDFASHDGTAKAGADYTAVSGTSSFAVGETAAVVTVPLLSGGKGTKAFVVDLANATSTLIGDGSARGLIVDQGSLGFRPLTPCRLVDTRDPGLGGPIPLPAGQSATFAITGHCSVPSNAKSVSANLTVTGATEGGHLRIYPVGVALPLVSVINYGAAQTRANSVVAVLGADGALAIYVGQASGSVHVILDVNGYFE